MRGSISIGGMVAFLALIGVLVATPAHTKPAPPAKALRTFDVQTLVRITDRHGVTTELTGFRRLFGPQMMDGSYGDADVEIPFDRIVAFDVGDPHDRYTEVRITLVDGGRMTIRVQPARMRTEFGGNASFGYYRIDFRGMSRCEFLYEKNGDEGGRRCPSGHLFFSRAWKYCPYDGKKLSPIEPRPHAHGSTDEPASEEAAR